MDARWRYRFLSALGTALLTVVAVWVTNLEAVHMAFANIPYFGRPAPEPLSAGEFTVALMTTLVVVFAAMWPLFKPRSRRMLDTILLTQKRIILAMVALAALGYFNYSYRLPRTTLMLTTVALLVALPLFMVAIRRRPQSPSRAVIVGDDPDAMEALLSGTEMTVLGYVSPPSAYAPDGIPHEVEVTDGGAVESKLDALPCLGGLARINEVFVKHDVDTVLLAFAETDREEFFGTLEHCHDHGVNALVHREHAAHVLTAGGAGGELLKVELEPWDWQDYVVKRCFDVSFAAVGLIVSLPVVAVISLAIKLDDGGPLLYRQERTAEFGRTFTVHKFRSMTPATEDSSPGSDEEYRVTRVGRILRKTHLDEIPQLWAILMGRMSVVGPRAVWTDEEMHLEEEAHRWRKRWFIKPGLTGLAQIHDATSADATTKLHYDLEYIRKQSFWFDVKIVVRQLWKVGTDLLGVVSGTSTEPPNSAESDEPTKTSESDGPTKTSNSAETGSDAKTVASDSEPPERRISE